MSLHLLGADVLTEAPSLDTVRAGRAVLKRGMRGDPISYVQRGLRLYDVVENGVFASDLEVAVKRFQGDYGLPTDGVIGRRTLAIIDKPDAFKPKDDPPEEAPRRSPVPIVTTNHAQPVVVTEPRPVPSVDTTPIGTRSSMLGPLLAGGVGILVAVGIALSGGKRR